MSDQTFSLYYGDTRAVEVTVYDEAGALVDVAGDTASLAMDLQRGGVHVVVSGTDSATNKKRFDFAPSSYGTASDKLRPGRYDFAVWIDGSVVLKGVADVVAVPQEA